ncbi:hypothetical protein TNCV_4435151 [Trichonephila clavipes]|nr:hypothetical protein TNCV_4435151 [Trichonephila clavipes]
MGEASGGRNRSDVTRARVEERRKGAKSPKNAFEEHQNAAVTKRVFQSIDCGTSCVTCCAVLLEPQLLDIMIVQFRNEKVSNHGSIPITIDCNVVAFIVFEEGFHQPIKRTKQSVFLDVTVFRHTLVD